MPYLVDGNNLCGAARDRRLGIPMDEKEMILRLQALCMRDSQELTVVFDGAPSEERGFGRSGAFGGVRVAYSGDGRSADDAIVELVESAPARREIVLVSSDRALRTNVRALGARVMRCRRFSELIRDAGPAPDTPEGFHSAV